MALFLSDLFDEKEFVDLQGEGYVRTQKHSQYPLRIANYTEKAQFDRVWNDVTLQCRGLIYRSDTREVVARPWKKFFNWDDSMAGPIPGGTMIKAPKMDGSLGILYRTPHDEHKIASRGSFNSEQAGVGCLIFERMADEAGFEPEPDKTYLFEIIYPQNRIVVDYGDDETLVLLDVIDNATGRPAWEEFDACVWPNKVAKTLHSGFDHSLVHEIKDNEEGFVLYFPYHEHRVKMKGAEYLRLHRIVTNCTARTIWEYLSTGKSLVELLEKVPDEFYQWVKKTATDMQDQYDATESAAKHIFKATMNRLDGWHRFDREGKKEFALAVKDLSGPLPALLFRMWDDQPYADIIWKYLRPEHTKPFWSDEE